MERLSLEGAIRGNSPGGHATAPRKRQVRFSARHDIVLLREVIAQNPFSSKEPGRVWARVGELMTEALREESFEVDARRCRERTMLLLNYYKKQDFLSLRRFGTEALYAEKEDLLNEVLELEAEKGVAACGDVNKYQVSVKKTTLKWRPRPNVPASAAARPTRRFSASWRNATRQNNGCGRRNSPSAGRSLRSRGKFTLERERLEADRKEREGRFELESQERQVILDLLKVKVLGS